MNKLSLGEPVWLASDIHLGPDNPQTSAAFYAFLALARQRAHALILLGDIFNVWIGDDWVQHPPQWLRTALTHLQKTGESIPLYLLGGNRDFLMSNALAHAVHAHWLESATILEINPSQTSPQNPAQQYLIAHGDEFCTSDLAYQRFRRLVRRPYIQKLFLALPLAIRNRIAMRARQASLETERAPFDARYDIQDDSLAPLLQTLQIQTCIHGHTHRPGHAIIKSCIDAQDHTEARPMTRWVLPDWECDGHEHNSTQAQQTSKTTQPHRGGWIEIDHSGIHPKGLSALEAHPPRNLTL